MYMLLLLLQLHCFLVLPYHDRGMIVSLCVISVGDANRWCVGGVPRGGPLTTTGVLACFFGGIRTGLGLRWRNSFLGQFTTTTGTGRRILRNGGIGNRSSDREEEQRNKNRREDFHDEMECCVRVCWSIIRFLGVLLDLCYQKKWLICKLYAVAK